ncbi:MAG: hypothetical protein M3Q46_01380 [Verrucomicrobiota bacterium]|nr:hypothetical protein [Verrucomicrobiota bacterium]
MATLIGFPWLLLATELAAQSCAEIDLGPGASLNGFRPFPDDNPWNADISALPVDPNSANFIAFIGATAPLHPDFGAGLYAGSTIGIPYQVEDATQAKVPVKLAAYRDESDPGPMPIPADALIEGYPKPGQGDRHVLVLDRDGCWLYESGRAFFKNGTWRADATAIWDMTLNEQRPYTWTSADAAGLPIFPGLVRYDEVTAGAINHAIRVTVPVTRQAFISPASHWASTVTDPNAPPMGLRMRLKASFDISGFPASAQVILTALKQYGLMVADNGSAMFISGAPDDRWNNSELDQLKTLTASDFEVVLLGPVYTPANVPTGPSPTLTNVVAVPSTITAGQPVTLSWNVSNVLYTIVSPEAGPVRESSTVVYPTVTTTYKVYATNQYGRTTKSVKVTVQ